MKDPVRARGPVYDITCERSYAEHHDLEVLEGERLYERGNYRAPSPHGLNAPTGLADTAPPVDPAAPPAPPAVESPSTRRASRAGGTRSRRTSTSGTDAGGKTENGQDDPGRTVDDNIEETS